MNSTQGRRRRSRGREISRNRRHRRLARQFSEVFSLRISSAAHSEVILHNIHHGVPEPADRPLVLTDGQRQIDAGRPGCAQNVNDSDAVVDDAAYRIYPCF